MRNRVALGRGPRSKIWADSLGICGKYNGVEHAVSATIKMVLHTKLSVVSIRQKKTWNPVKGLYYATWYDKSYGDVWEYPYTIRGLFFKHHCEWHGWSRICSTTAFMVFHRTAKMGLSTLKVELCNLRYPLRGCIWHHYNYCGDGSYQTLDVSI